MHKSGLPEHRRDALLLHLPVCGERGEVAAASGRLIRRHERGARSNPGSGSCGVRLGCAQMLQASACSQEASAGDEVAHSATARLL